MEIRYPGLTLILSAILAATLVTAGPAESPQLLPELLEKAIFTEETVGDLDRAIELYEEIVSRTEANRTYGAQAQFRLGMCQLKKGNEDKAVAALQKLVADFPRQAELVEQARARLLALGHPVPSSETDGGQVERMVLSDRQTKDSNDFLDMDVSPDGSRVAYVRYGSDGALCVRELKTLEVTKLTGDDDGYVSSPRWSRDGRRIAYANMSGKLKIVDFQSKAISTVPSDDGMGLEPRDWSPDGTKLLSGVGHPDGRKSLALVVVQSGAITPLVKEGWGSRPSAAMAVEGGARQRITPDVGGGGRPRWSPDGDTIVYLNEYGAWSIAVAEGRPRGEARLVRSEDFGYPVSWSAAGGFSYVKSNSASRNFSLAVDPDTAEPLGPPVPMEIKPETSLWLAWSPDMSRIAHVENGANDIVHVYSTVDRSSRSFRTGLERNPAKLWWSGDGTEILLVPYSNQSGTTILALNPADGGIRSLFPRTKDAGARFDLTADGQRMLFYRHTGGERHNGQRRLMVSDVGDMDGRVLVAEEDMAGGFSNWVRPVLSPDGTRALFASWDGATNDLWVVSTDGSDLRRLATVTFDPEGAVGGGSGKPFLHAAVWSPNGRFIAYDDSLSLFIVDVETRKQREIRPSQGFEGVGVMDWSPDGKQIGHSNWAHTSELWVVRNLLGTQR
jgi:Tol biopolymer transport system component